MVRCERPSAFNAATAKGSSAEEAAAKTWTGQRALEAGYPKTKILEARGKKGHFTEVRVLFSRGTR